MAGEDDRSEALNRVLEGVERVFADYTERRPRAVRIQASDELVSVLMDDELTEMERGLADHDGGQGIRHLRLEEQDAMRDALVAVVEAELGQEVVAFLSANHVDPDVAVETFVLSTV